MRKLHLIFQSQCCKLLQLVVFLFSTLSYFTVNPSERCLGEIKGGETQLQTSAAKKQRKKSSSIAWLKNEVFEGCSYIFFAINWD